MTYSHPLIKQLKAHTLKIIQEIGEKTYITDDSKNILPLCDAIERIFQEGCFLHSWNALNEIAQISNLSQSINNSFSYSRNVCMVRSCEMVKTPTGKLRLLIRSCLVNKCIHVPIEILVRTHRNVTCARYNMEKSIIGNEILGEILLSVLLQCSAIQFKLDLDNSRFLDDTPVLPRCVLLEFVPCSSLGVTVTFVGDKAVVVHVNETSVAAEDNQIEIGDVLHGLNGQLLHSELKGKLKCLMKGKNKPVSVKLIKSKCPEDGSIYPPIDLLLKKANINVQYKANTTGKKMSSKNKGITNEVNYIGSVDVGPEGDVKMIEYAISEITRSNHNRNLVRVRIECQELGLKIIREMTGEILASNSFMEISSCGQTKKHPDFFGYIAGDNICNLATKFTCHVFQTNCDSDIQTILQSIGDGFQRTHFAV